MAIVLANRIEELEPFYGAWDELARVASEPNPFFERWVLVPALRHLQEGTDVTVALVTGAGGELNGLMPFIRGSRYRGVPLPHTAVWKHQHCFLCTPLLRKGSEDAAIGELLSERRSLWGLVTLFPYIDATGPAAQALQARMKTKELSADLVDSGSRPLLVAEGDLSAYLERAIQPKHIRDLEKRRAKLAAQGELTVEVQWDGQEIEKWCDEFCRVEAAGWKGAGKSAIASNPAEQRFFFEMASEGAKRGSLLRATIRFDGRPIAITCLLIASEWVYAWKIAYDESFARFSPGVLMVVEVMRAVFSRRDIVNRIDSCADPNHPVLSRFWMERRAISSVGMSRPSWSSRAAVAAVSRTVRLKRTLRGVELPEPSGA